MGKIVDTLLYFIAILLAFQRLPYYVFSLVIFIGLGVWGFRRKRYLDVLGAVFGLGASLVFGAIQFELWK